MANASGTDGRSQIRRKAGLRLWLSAGWLGFLVLAALLAPWIAPQHPYDLDTAEGLVRRPDAGPVGSLMLWLNRRSTLPRLQGLLRGRRSVPFAARLAEIGAQAAAWKPAA